MSSSDIEYRYPIGGGWEGLLRFDGRIIEFFNLGSGGSFRYPYPEVRIERSEPSRKGKVTFAFSASDHLITEFPVEADHVAGFDAFLARVHTERSRL